MSGNKTVATDSSVERFIESVADETKRRDSRDLVVLMGEITGSEPSMWGSSMVGFGQYHYTYASGREGDFFITGFSPRQTALTVYVMPGLDRYAELRSKLGPHKTGKSCLYIKSLDAVNRDVLKELISDSVTWMREKYECS